MTSNVRSVTVRLDAAVAGYIAKMKRAGQETDKAFTSAHTSIARTNTELDMTHERLRVVHGDLGILTRNTQTSGREIDRLSGRLALMAKGMAIFGPGLVPIAAVGIPALAGLSSQLGFAAAGAGTAVLAFQGFGDAMKAVNEAALEPTTDNLEAARVALDRLTPAGRRLVGELRGMSDEFKTIRDVAQENVLGGVTRGLRDVDDILPNVTRGIDVISEALGDLAAMSGRSLASEQWQDFYSFLVHNARPALLELGQTIGNVAGGMAELWMAFDPINDDFSGWLLGISSSFEEWSSSLSQSDGFAGFVDYLRSTGPQVAETLEALAGAMLGIVTAASPLGGPVLQGIEAFADAVAAIAESDLGTPIFTALAAMSALSLATSAWGRVSKSSAGQFIDGQVKASAGVKTLRSDLQMVNKSLSEVGAMSKKEFGAYQAAGQRVRGTLVGIGKTAGTVGAVAFATSGLADSMGLANTATSAMMGAMVGGAPGAVAGGLIGAFMDFTSGADKADGSLRRWNDALRSGETDVAAYAAILQDAQDHFDDLSQAVPTSFGDALTKAFNPDTIKLSLTALTGGNLDDSAVGQQAAAANRLRMEYGDLQLAINEIGRGLGGIEWGTSVTDVEGLNRIVERVTPAMEALGITTEDLMQAARDGSIITLVDRLVDWTRYAETSEGKTRSLAAAMRALDDDMLSTADSAAAVARALDELLSPKLDLSEATDAWTASLRTLDDDLAKNNKTLQGNSNAALKNRGAVRDRVRAMQDVLNAEAAAGASAGQLSQKLRAQRQALLDAGAAAGISRGQMREYLDTLGLTPKMVRTLVALNTESAMASLRQARRKLDEMDGRTATARMEIITVHKTVGNATDALPDRTPQVGSTNANGGIYYEGQPEVAYAAGGFVERVPVRAERPTCWSAA